MPVISLELNELNFDYVGRFVGEGKLPNFARILERNQLTRTTAEKKYPLLEPWIQWPTVYSGLEYSQHEVFRLGDIVGKSHPQIWDELESEGLKVGAISPMNAANNCKNPAFFLPDPWTNTRIVADPRTEKLWKLIASLVNANASDSLGVASVGRQLGPLLAGYVRVGSMGRHLRVLRKAVRHKWAKAIFLDSLLYDLAMSLISRHKPDFVSVFMNAGAHVQHHHTFDSSAYDGDFSNPAWYSTAADTDEDPLLFVYELYDDIIGDLLRHRDFHVLITTGLSQTPNPREHYQYRLVDFARFLGRIGLQGATVEPRMSRDFLLAFAERAQAEKAMQQLDNVAVDGKSMFKVDDRGLTLFCQVGYIGRPDRLSEATIDGAPADLSKDFVLVSIENAIHQTTGYHMDLSVPRGAGPEAIKLTEVHDRVMAAALTDARPGFAKAA